MYCGRNGMAYGYGVQIAPSSDVRTICPSFTKLKASEYTSEYEFICYRPVVEEDEEGNERIFEYYTEDGVRQKKEIESEKLMEEDPEALKAELSEIREAMAGAFSEISRLDAEIAQLEQDIETAKTTNRF